MSQTGLVAFFDILGYQDIINNNLIDDVAKIISEIILGLPEDARKTMSARFPDGKSKSLIEACCLDINARIISDSIILSLELPQNTSELIKTLYWYIFLLYVSALFFKSFDKGLPLRGAVDYGEFFLAGQCFAGKPLVECYRLSNDLEVAGCVITQNAKKYSSELSDKAEENTYLKDYLV